MAMDMRMIILYVVLGLIGLVVLIAIPVLGYIFFFKGRKKNPFILYNKEGDKMRIVSAEVRRNPENKKDLFYYIPSLDAVMAITPPTKYIDGVGYREIIMNRISEYSYLKTNAARLGRKIEPKDEKKLKENQVDKPVLFGETKIDLEKDIEMSLNHEEKQITLFRLHQYQEKYQVPITKGEIALLIGFIILFILSLIGNGYVVYQAGKNLAYVSEISADNAATAAAIAANSKIELEVLNMQSLLIAQIMGSGNITRQVG